MALGGGAFIAQNKILPGSYINFVSASRVSSMMSDRGVVALALELDWCSEDEVFKVTYEEFQRYALKKFGYNYDHKKLKGLRDLFKNAKEGYFYRLNKGVKSTNKFATARYSGIRGNDIKIIIETNIDNGDLFDVSTMLDNKKVDLQIVSATTDLKDNDWVSWNKSQDLELTASTPLAGGTNGSSVTGTEYQKFLDKIESYNFDTIGCLSTSDEIKNLFVAFTKRMREDIGLKCQAVLYKKETADHEGIISAENSVKDDGELESSLVYWTLGAEAGCAINKSNTNKKYDGEFIVNVDYTQLELEEALLAGKFIFHKVGDEIRILEDINTFTSFTEEKTDDFASNQTIRVLDQIANDIAILFNKKYLGNIPNTPSGRVSFWNDIVTHHKGLEELNALESFKPDEIIVEEGNCKKSVVVTDAVEVINAMEKLYMTVAVK
ncbi:phage tail sheath family protein [Clostridium sp. CCUG 7971]|uniref:phage tail sheath family protein n=1 Tax=Clostridium sp. CCUG 7971 TaxID=2811414 RepID=UPI001ABB4959|nr:phage tail sheath family protein [Clostridium sp. CCUG 7971]MBO3444017.1 phage tail sheath family protein [Clostridium sp. CCUG 7971]